MLYCTLTYEPHRNPDVIYHNIKLCLSSIHKKRVRNKYVYRLLCIAIRKGIYILFRVICRYDLRFITNFAHIVDVMINNIHSMTELRCIDLFMKKVERNRVCGKYKIIYLHDGNHNMYYNIDVYIKLSKFISVNCVLGDGIVLNSLSSCIIYEYDYYVETYSSNNIMNYIVRCAYESE